MTDAIQPISNVALRAARARARDAGADVLRPSADRRSGRATAPPTCAAIDELAYGFDREVDHRHWSQHARRTDWRDAYSYVFPGGEIGPVAGATPAAAAAALAGELAAADGRRARPHPRIGPRCWSRSRWRPACASPRFPGLLLLSRGVEPPTALAPSSYALY